MTVQLALEVSSQHVGCAPKTISRWTTEFIENGYAFSQSQQGYHTKTPSQLSNGEIYLVFRQYIMDNRRVKGKARLTISTLHDWTNKYLRDNDGVEVSQATIHCWVKKCGFNFVTKKKGVYIDGHDQGDVEQHRKEFVFDTEKAEFNQPLWFWDKEEECWRHIDEIDDVEVRNNEFFGNLGGQFREEVTEKTLAYWHDESIFNANDGDRSFWGISGETCLISKGKGAGIMISDFIGDHCGWLQLSDSEKEKHPTQHPKAQRILEYNKSGYNNNDDFLTDVKRAIDIHNIKYPNHKAIFYFDNSKVHTKKAKDALNSQAMNAKEGGKQPNIRSTQWTDCDKVIHQQEIGQKGLEKVLRERGLYKNKMKVAEMREILGEQPDFKNTQAIVEELCTKHGHEANFIPKFHCEFTQLS